MPTYPTPGAGLSVAGLNKLSGFKSPPDEGINHTAGLRKDGLDTKNNPYVSAVAATAVTATGATVNWQTAPATPLGSVSYRKVSGGAATTVNETGTPPVSTHSVPLTGLAAGTSYDIVITQPGPTTPPPQRTVQIVARIKTTGAGPGDLAGGGEPQPAIRDTTRVTDSRDLLADGAGAPAAPARTGPTYSYTPAVHVRAAEEGLFITSVKVEPLSPTSLAVTWRTDAYADGVVSWTGDGGSGSEVEAGNRKLNHVVNLTGLAPGTTYDLVIEGEDAAGDVGRAEATGTTPPE